MIEVRCFGSLKEAAFLRDEVNALNRACARPVRAQWPILCGRLRQSR